MKRLLVIGKKLPRLMCIEWRELSQHNLLDYQGLHFDCREYNLIPDQRRIAQDLHLFVTNGQTAFIILPESEAFEKGFVLELILYIRLQAIQAKGRTLKPNPQIELAKEYCKSLREHEFVMSAATLHPIYALESIVTDNVNRPVCGQVRSIFVFHPPSRGLEEVAFNSIINYFKPDFEEPEPEPTPVWAANILSTLPGMPEVDTAINEIDEAVSTLQRKRGEETERKRRLERWAEVLWFDGILLQNRVREAFEFLGFAAESHDPTGHARDIVIKCAGVSFVVEVAGSTRSIDIDKGRQLLQWIADAEDPGKVNGLLVGNAFRTEPPANRPPTQDHRIFTEKLEQMARRRHFALLDVRDLFALVTRKLKGDSIDLDELCATLTVGGIVRIPS